MGGEDTGYWFMNIGDEGGELRKWEHCVRYGFMQAGGGPRWINSIKRLKEGDMLFVYLREQGYVGLGRVIAAAVPFKEFMPPGRSEKLSNLLHLTADEKARMANPETEDACVAIEWIKTLSRDQGILMHRALRGTVCGIKQPDLVEELLKTFDPDASLT